MQTQPFRKVIVLIFDTDTNEFLFDGCADQLNLLSFNYNPAFDPWDNMALGRFLYQKQKQISIDSDLMFVQMLQDEEFKDLLNIINGSQVVLTEENLKCFFIQTNKLQLQKITYTLKVQDLEKKLDMFNSGDRQIIESYLIKKVQDTVPKKVFCILEDAVSSDRFFRHVNQALYHGLYQEQNEIWLYYKVFKGEFPSRDEFEQIEAFAMTGSSCSAYIKEPWYDQYSEFLKRIMDANKRILGVCFGHQILAQFFGGATSKLPNIPEEYHNHYGVQKVRFIDSNTEHIVFVHHGDNVTALPKDTKLLMTSDYCPVQAYASQNILGLQFHPEFNIPLIKYIISQSKHTSNSDQLIQKFESSQTANNYDSTMIREYLISYLKTGKLLPRLEMQKNAANIF